MCRAVRITLLSPLLSLFPLAAHANNTTSGPQRTQLMQAHALYQQREVDRAQTLLQTLLAALKRPADLRDAHLLLSACALLRDDEISAERSAIEALSYDPSYSPDPLLFAPDVQSFVRSVAFRKRALIARLAATRAQVVDDLGTASDRSSHTVARAPYSTPTSSGATVLPPRRRSSALVAWLPFGIGQFANHQPTKGWLLFGVEVGLVAASVAALVTALALRDAHGTYAASDLDTARALNVAYLASAYSAGACMLYGAIDGLLHR